MQLTYRGQTFNYSPATLPLASVTDGVIRTLFYRGNAYQCQCATVRSIRSPKAVNWRFAGVVEKQQQNLRPAH